jgi:hypothetical protein
MERSIPVERKIQPKRYRWSARLRFILRRLIRHLEGLI